jgi:hypothetical protein
VSTQIPSDPEHETMGISSSVTDSCCHRFLLRCPIQIRGDLSAADSSGRCRAISESLLIGPTWSQPQGVSANRTFLGVKRRSL